MKMLILLVLLSMPTLATAGPLHWTGHAIAHCPVLKAPAKGAAKVAKATAKGAAHAAKGVAKGVAKVGKAVY